MVTGVKTKRNSLKIDRTGMRYGHLLINGWSHSIYRSPRNGSYQFWSCICDCGQTVVVLANNLVKGNTTSCGCKSSRLTIGDKATTHGKSKSPEYVSWRAMKDRCYGASHSEYKRYGALGIKVCERWINSFANFFEDMGPRPHGHSLERINPSKNYEPVNCKWADVYEQANNKKNTRKIEYKGASKSVTQWSREVGLKTATLSARLNRGWPVEKALFSGVRQSGDWR
jgi:hypothetical protein